MKGFVDEATTKVYSGHGGPGSHSFRREKYIPKGGPDGGDGGRGGDVIFITDDRIKTLAEIARKREFKAPNGMGGSKRNRSGESGEDVIIKIPVGTIIKNLDSGVVIIDMNKVGMKFVAAKGGLGGKGNQHFATSVNQAPTYAQPGLPGEERALHFTLKIIADIGLIGLPNGGKSTLLKALTKANPKIGDYPFTTLNPNLGVMKTEGLQSLIIADIPGIIEGAADGKGLGIQFLKHIERTRLLILVVDFFTDDPAQTEKVILNELKNFSESLANKPLIMVANKMDLPEAVEKSKKFPNYIAISAVTHMGLKKLKNKLLETFSKMD